MKYVYLVRAGNDHYKVGVAANVSDRVRGLQTSNGHAIELIMARRTAAANQLEKMIHESLAVQQLDGGGKEWFILSPQQVVDLAIKINSIDLVPSSDVERLQDAIEDVNANQDIIYKMMEELIQKIDSVEPSRRGSKPTELPEARQRREDVDNKLFDEATEVVQRAGEASASMLQRRLRVGYARAARLIDQLEAAGIVGAADGARPRELLQPEQV